MSESGTFWEKLAPIIFSEEKLRLAGTEIRQVVQILNGKTGQRILDLGCGIGRHSLELAKLNYVVTGLDITPSFIETAKQTAERDAIQVEFIQGNMLEFVRPKSFDIAISLFTSFGYFEDQNDNQLVLSNICESLVDGGTFVLQLKAKEIIARTFVEKDWEQVDDYLLLQERSINNDWNWMNIRMIFLEGSSRQEYTSGMWLYSASELKAMLKRVGFSKIEILGDFDRSAYDNRAQKTVMIAHK